MRELKFRVWVKTNNSQQKYSGMYLVYALAPDGVTVIRSSVFSPNIFPIDDVEIMQYTGLHDKNGKEIYEGDIVKYQISDTQHSIGDVQWDNLQMRFFFSGYYHGTLDSYYIVKSEVIGNIYENPELLKNNNAKKD
jgi:uncharacterized phage protein (TIGR01671 family)